MKNNENNPIDYTIVSKPAFINFICPLSDVDFKTDYWSDGAHCNCPLCDKEVELGYYDYD